MTGYIKEMGDCKASEKGMNSFPLNHTLYSV